MDIVNSSDLNHILRFRVKEEWVEITFNMIGSLLGFWENCPENIEVNQEVLENSWLQIAEDSSKERMKIVNPILKIIHRFMTLRVIERLDDTKVQNAELKWLYVALRHPMRTNPIFSMINHWIIQRNRNTEKIEFGHYLTIIASALRPDLVFNPKFKMLPASIDGNSLKKGRVIQGNSTTGYFVGKNKFKIPSPKLALFAQGRIDWLEKFLTEEGESSGQPSSGWSAWETPSVQPNPFMAEQFRAGSSSTPVFNPRPISSFDPTSTPVFNPSGQYGPPPAFIPRSARTYTPEFIASQNMPHQAFYGIENMTAENYQLIDQMRTTTNQYEQNTKSIEEQLQNLRFWNQGFQ